MDPCVKTFGRLVVQVSRCRGLEVCLGKEEEKKLFRGYRSADDIAQCARIIV